MINFVEGILVEGGTEAVVALLLARGASRTLEDVSGMTASARAARAGHAQLARVLEP